MENQLLEAGILICQAVQRVYKLKVTLPGGPVIKLSKSR